MTDPQKPFRELIEVAKIARGYLSPRRKSKEADTIYSMLLESIIAAEAALPALPALYPCCECGVLRTKDQGGDTFTVCDSCWDKLHLRAKPAFAGKKNFFDLSTEERNAIMNKSLEGMSP